VSRRKRPKIQRYLHILSFLVAFALPFKLLEIAHMDHTFIILLYRTADLVAIMGLFYMFQVIAYYATMAVVLQNRELQASVPRWFVRLHVAIATSTLTVGVVCEVMMQLRDRVWYYSGFLWWVAASITLLYAITVYASIRVKRELARLAKHTGRYQKQAPSTMSGQTSLAVPAASAAAAAAAVPAPKKDDAMNRFTVILKATGFMLPFVGYNVIFFT
jgi:hypothetical protein